MTRVSDMHKRWLKDPKYRNAYAALQKEFALAGAVIEARKRAGLTQQQLARKMGTTQPAVARLESGTTRPSLRTLERLAKATGSRLLISFQPREVGTNRQVIASKSFEMSLSSLAGAGARVHAARKTG
ncbi:MAG TPA: helix-turn-helix transcriptional regulator [Candidatus Binatia bacterium]|nr:helix-turn-helix transcriptional regulator [Candidatus Binatia bacterium]